MDAKTDNKSAGKCPFTGNTRGRANRDWWPNQLDIQVLHRDSDLSDPMARDFNYAQEFKSLALNAVIRDLHALMTDSHDWRPADFGHYGGLMIRMAWHSAGTVIDNRDVEALKAKIPASGLPVSQLVWVKVMNADRFDSRSANGVGRSVA